MTSAKWNVTTKQKCRCYEKLLYIGGGEKGITFFSLLGWGPKFEWFYKFFYFSRKCHKISWTFWYILHEWMDAPLLHVSVHRNDIVENFNKMITSESITWVYSPCNFVGQVSYLHSHTTNSLATAWRLITSGECCTTLKLIC